MNFTTELNLTQLGLLLDTVEGLGDDNKKAVHIPSDKGDIYTVALTTEALKQMMKHCEEEQTEDPVRFEIEIIAHDNGTSTISVASGDRFTLRYDVVDDEFQVE